MSEGFDQTRGELEAKIGKLEAELADREAALPAHSVRAHQLAEIEDLEDQIAELREQLAGLGEGQF